MDNDTAYTLAAAISSLAAQAASIGGPKFFESAASEAGKSSWNAIKRVFATIRSKGQDAESPSLDRSLNSLLASPNDSEVERFARALQPLILADSNLADQLHKLVIQAMEELGPNNDQEINLKAVKKFINIQNQVNFGRLSF